MYDNLYSEDINQKYYPLFLSKISNCERIYYEILQIYSETIVIIRKYKFDINLDLNTLYGNVNMNVDNNKNNIFGNNMSISNAGNNNKNNIFGNNMSISNAGNNNLEEQNNIKKNNIKELIKKNNVINTNYSDYKTMINNIIENIDKENNNIDKYLLSNKNKNKDSIIQKLITLKNNINIIDLKIENLNKNNSKFYFKNYFYKLLSTIFTYIKYSNSYEILFLRKIIKSTSSYSLKTFNYNTIKSSLSSIKDIEFEYNKILKEHENYLNQSIKDADEEKANLEEEKKTIEEENIEDVDIQIRTITTKIDQNDKELKAYKTKIDKYKTDIDKLKKLIESKDYPPLKVIEDGEKIIKLEGELKIELESEESLKEQQKLLQSEKDELTKNKLKNSIIIKKRKMNIEVIKKLIALYENIHKVCDEVKQDDVLKPLTTEFESANEYSSNIVKFIKELKKENENNNENNIVSCFKQNHLILLDKKVDKEIKNGKNTDLFKSILTSPVFFNKSKIKTKQFEEENPYFNIDFIEAIRQYIGNDTFIDFLKNENNAFKSIIVKLLKENRNNKKFQYIINTVTNKFKDNCEKLLKIIDKCTVDEEKYKKDNKKNTEIYPYTNFIISYFAHYLMIINEILYKL